MMYADYEYYKTEYGGRIFESADSFEPYAKKASRQIDQVTFGRLTEGLPDQAYSVRQIMDCTCEVAEFLYQTDAYSEAVNDVGYIKDVDGTLKGKHVKSVSSGSESISYDTGAGIVTAVSEAVKSKQALDMQLYGIIRGYLSGIGDRNGVNLLYAGYAGA